MMQDTGCRLNATLKKLNHEDHEEKLREHEVASENKLFNKQFVFAGKFSWPSA